MPGLCRRTCTFTPASRPGATSFPAALHRAAAGGGDRGRSQGLRRPRPKPGEWIIGGSWVGAACAKPGEQHKRLLDAVAPEVARVMLNDESLHSVCRRTRVLALAGITAPPRLPKAALSTEIARAMTYRCCCARWPHAVSNACVPEVVGRRPAHCHQGGDRRDAFS